MRGRSVLEAIADAITGISDALVERRMAEIGLLAARLQGDRGRTVGQGCLLASFATVPFSISGSIRLCPTAQSHRDPTCGSVMCRLGPLRCSGVELPARSLWPGQHRIGPRGGRPSRGHGAFGASRDVGTGGWAVQKAVAQRGMPKGILADL